MSDQDTRSAESPPMMWKVIIPSMLLIALVVPISMALKSGGTKSSASDGADQRIAPVASVMVVKASVASGPRTGEQIYNAVCTACHGTGAAGAPKKGDKAAWAPRIGQGIAGLVKSATAGKGGMPPKGGAADLSEAELKSAIEYLTK